MCNGHSDVQKNNIFDAQCLVRALWILFGKHPLSPVLSHGKVSKGAGLPRHLTWLLGFDLGLATWCPVMETLSTIGPTKVNPQTSEETSKGQMTCGRETTSRLRVKIMRRI